MIQLISRRPLKKAFAVLVCMALAACAGAPVQEMSDARQAIRAAFDAGADRVAPESLTAAREYIQRAEANLQRRNYRDARRDAVAARGKAVEALGAAQSAATVLPESR
jgi:hypothetical protein